VTPDRVVGGSFPEGMPRIQQTTEIFRMEDGMMAEHWDVLQMTRPGKLDFGTTSEYGR